jgi:hypothetical protein
MKIETIVHALRNWANKYPLVGIVALSVLCLYCVYGHYSIIWSFDTESYQCAVDSLMRGEIDTFRTPVYPAALAVCQMLTSHGSYWLIIVVHLLIFYLSVCSLYRTILCLSVAKNIAIIVTAIYATCPMILLAQCIVMTESFAISFSVFMVSYFVRWRTRCKIIDFYRMSLCVLFLLFLRPSFLYLLVAFAMIALILMYRHQYRYGAQLLIMITAFGGLMFGYCRIIESKTGVFTPSTVSVLNEYVNAFHIGKFTSANVTDSLIKSRVLEFERDSSDKGAFYVPDMDGVPSKQIYDELQRMKERDNLITLKVFVMHCEETAYGMYGVFRGFNFDFRIIYLFLFAVGCLFTYMFVRRRIIPIVAFSLWLMCVGHIVVALLGSYAEWSRMFLPAFPLLLLLVALFCHFFRISRVDFNKIM